MRIAISARIIFYKIAQLVYVNYVAAFTALNAGPHKERSVFISVEHRKLPGRRIMRVPEKKEEISRCSSHLPDRKADGSGKFSGKSGVDRDDSP